MPAGLRLPMGRFMEEEARFPLGAPRAASSGGLSAFPSLRPPMRSADGGLDTGFRAGRGRPVSVPGYDVATTNWQNQVGKARVGGITADGRRLDGSGRGLFTRDRVRRQPSREDKFYENELAKQRLANEGIFGAEQIRASAARYGTDANLLATGMQDATTRRGQGLEFGLGAKKIQAERDQAIRADETTRRGQGLEFGLGKQRIEAEREGALRTDETTRRGQDLTMETNRGQLALEREKLDASRQPKSLPGVVNVGGVWHTQDPDTGEAVRLPDADQKRLTLVSNLASSFPRSVTKPELDAFTADPNRFIPVYDYQTGRVALKPADTSGMTPNWQNHPIGSGKQKQLRYQPLADFEPTAYQAFLEWANAHSGARP